MKKGGDEWQDPAYWRGVAEQGVYGAVNAGVWEGLLGATTGRIGKSADALTITEHITELDSTRTGLWKSGKLDVATNARIDALLASDYRALSEKLRGMNESARARLIREANLGGIVKADGTLTEGAQDLVARLEASGAQLTTPGAKSATAGEKAGSGAFDVRYYTPTMSVEEVTDALRRGGATPIEGELTGAENKNYRAMRTAFEALKSETGMDLNLVLAETVAGDNGFSLSTGDKAGTVVIGRSRLGGDAAVAADAWMATLSHEVFHFTGDTTSGRALHQYLSENTELFGDAVESFLRSGYLGSYEESRRLYNAAMEKAASGAALTAADTRILTLATDELGSIMVEKALGNRRFAADLIARNSGAVGKLIYKLRQSIEALRTMGNPEAKQLRERFRAAEQLFLDAATEAGYVYRAGTLIANGGEDKDEGEVRYSLSENAERDVERALNDTSFRDDVYLTESSPAIIANQEGVRNLPMLMKASHIRENVFTEAEAKRRGLRTDRYINYHGLGKELFLNIIAGLDDVSLAYRGTRNASDSSRRENYFLLISQYKDSSGNTINVPVYINEKGQYNRVFIDTNKVATVFGREGLNDYLRREVQNGNLVRIKNRSTQASERPTPIVGGYSKSASDISISQTTANVNPSKQKNFGNLSTDADSDVRHSRSETYDYSKSFAEQIDDFKKGNIPARDSLVVSGTPEILQRIGFNALPITINQTHVNYALNGTKDADHFLGESLLKQLPQALENPVAVIASQSKTNRAMVILKFSVNGRQAVVPVEIDGFAHLNNIRIDSNAVVSVYGKNSALNQLFSAISDESNKKTSLYYWNKKEAMTLLQSAGHQLSGGLPQDGFIHSIRENSSPVKSKFENVTETQQFKRWFGDWQNHPESASKVVNDDGTPRVVYHGTNAKFWTFDLSRSGSNFGDVAEGLFFFTNKKSGYQNSASDYARNAVKNGGEERVLGCYLNMKKPLVLHSDGYYTPTAYFDKNAEAVYKQYLNGDYDGIIIENSDKSVDDSVIYMLDNPTQIKSATGNLGTFDAGNPDIRYSKAEQSQETSPRRVKTPISDEARAQIEERAQKIRDRYEAQIEEEASKIREKFDAGDGQTLQEIQEERFGKSLSERIAEEDARYQEKKAALEESERLTDVARERRLAALEREHAERLSRIREEQGALDDAIRHAEELRDRMEAEVREVRAPIADADQSRILTRVKREKISLAKRAEHVWDNMILNFTDDQHAIIKEGKRLGVADMDARANYARAAKNAAQYALEEKGRQVDAFGRDMGPGLSAIFRNAVARGEEYLNDFYSYLLWMHHADRIAQDKTVMGDYTAAEALAEADKLVGAHVEFRKMAEAVWKYSDNLMTLRVQLGLVSPALAKKLRATYPHYVPTMRADVPGSGAVVFRRGNGAVVDQTIKIAHGSTRDIMPLIRSMALQTMQTYQAARFNELVGTLVEAAEKSGGSENVRVLDAGADAPIEDVLGMIEGDGLLPEGGVDKFDASRDGVRTLRFDPVNQTVQYWKDGKRQTVQVSREIFHGLKAFMPRVELDNVVFRGLEKSTAIFKNLVTSWDPLFIARNFLRDVQEAFFSTGHSVPKFAATIPAAWKEILTNGKYWQEYQAAGGLSSSIYDYYDGVEGILKRRGTVKRAMDYAAGRMEYLNMLKYLRVLIGGRCWCGDLPRAGMKKPEQRKKPSGETSLGGFLFVRAEPDGQSETLTVTRVHSMRKIVAFAQLRGSRILFWYGVRDSNPRPFGS